VLLSFLCMAFPSVYAWGVSTNPGSRTVAPGGTTSFTVSVTGPVPGNPNVQLLISPPVVGITASFTTNNIPAPFTTTMVVSVASSKAPGTYAVPLWAHPANVLFPGPGNEATNFQIVVASTTDWAVASVGIQPPSPQVGDPVTLWAKVIALSTTGGYPQTFVAQCILDGSSCGSGALSYSGPTGVTLTVSSQSPWIATAGPHTLSWQVSTTDDPNPGNNFGSYTFSVAAPTPFDFDIVLSPNSLTLQPGQTQSVSVNVNLKSGAAQAVSLSVSGQPAGVTASPNPTSGTPSFSSTLAISVSGTTTPGTYSLTVTGSGGGQTHSAILTLTVSLGPDFRIDLSSPSQSATQGGTASYSVNVVGLNGFNSQVSLTVTGLPSGANGVFSTSTGTPTFPSTLTVTLPSGTSAGTYTLVIHGTGGGLDRTANAVLTVTAATTTQVQSTSQIVTTVATGTGLGGFLDMLQQNSLLIIAALVVLAIILVAALARRGRGRTTPPAQVTQVFCGKCGTGNSSSNEFCSNCGSRLKGS
jgi:hypothetical protein